MLLLLLHALMGLGVILGGHGRVLRACALVVIGRAAAATQRTKGRAGWGLSLA